jgi:hypothetical protein
MVPKPFLDREEALKGSRITSALPTIRELGFQSRSVRGPYHGRDSGGTMLLAR